MVVLLKDRKLCYLFTFLGGKVLSGVGGFGGEKGGGGFDV